MTEKSYSTHGPDDSAGGEESNRLKMNGARGNGLAPGGKAEPVYCRAGPHASAYDAMPDLIVNGADRPATARGLRDVLATADAMFDRGGIPVMLAEQSGGLPVARRVTIPSVINAAHALCRPVKIVNAKRTLITLPDAVAALYLALGDTGLPPLTGVCSTPLLANDGSIRTHRGYDSETQLFCVDVADCSVATKPSRADAELALALLRETFRTFPFADAARITMGGHSLLDVSRPSGQAETAFLAALLTATCRPSLWLAPGLLVSAPAISGAGSGKGLLVRSIAAVAFGMRPASFTAGHDKHELDKRLVAELINGRPMVFLDNVNETALRSHTLASVLTERPCRVRVLGRSEMVPLNAGAFIAVTGNGLSLAEDLVRRFLQSDLDPECEDPELRPFQAGFLNSIFAARAKLLTAVLTIWRWGRQNSATFTCGLPLGSFEIWSRWVRDPLLTLGCADPVERMLAAKANDPKRRFLAELFSAWWEAHGSAAVKASALAEPVLGILDQQKRGRQFVATKLGQLSGTRAAGWVLTRQESAGKWSAATYALHRFGL